MAKSSDRLIRDPETGDLVARHPAGLAYPASVRLMAKTMYTTGEYTVEQLSKSMNIPYNTLKEWAKAEHWTLLREEVQSAAAREAVAHSRKAMAKYFSAIDRRLKKAADALTKKIDGGLDKKIDSERDAYMLLLDVLTRQLQLARTALSGSLGRDFAPDPVYMQLDEPPTPSVSATGGMWSGTLADILAEALGNLSEPQRRALAEVLGVTGESDEEFAGLGEDTVEDGDKIEEGDSVSKSSVEPTEFL